MDVKRYLPQKTPIGTVMKESPEGYWVLLNDFDRVTAERDALQQLLNARDEQLSERDALLRDLEGKTILSWPDKHRISAALECKP